MSNKTAPAGSEKAAYQAVSRKDLTYRQWIWKEMKRNWVAYVMIAPYVIIFTLFTVHLLQLYRLQYVTGSQLGLVR